MPLYLYKCTVCAAKRDVFKPIAEIDRSETCHKCSFGMIRQICAPMIRPDLPGYDCPVTGKWIEGRVAHAENLKQHGCRVLEPGEVERAQAVSRQQSEDLFERVGEDAARLVAEMPPEKQERLANELDAGLDVSYERNSVTP